MHAIIDAENGDQKDLDWVVFSGIAIETVNREV